MSKTRTVIIQYVVELPIMRADSIMNWAESNVAFMQAEQGVKGFDKIFKPHVQKVQVVNNKESSL